MKQKAPKEKSTCVICGYVGEMTRDHIPPKSLFAKPLPSDLLTVPVCRKCNGGASADDEYFRNVICLSEYRGDNRHGIKGTEASIRSLARSRSHLRKVLGSASRVPLETESGIVYGFKTCFTIDLSRIHAVASRIMRGVFYLETGLILPRNHEVMVEMPETYDALDDDFKALYFDCVIKPLMSRKEKSFADGNFKYKFARPDGSDYLAGCIMTFYDCLPMVCITGTEEQRAGRK